MERTYYVHAKVNGKQKWRSLKTTVFSAVNFQPGDAEKQVRT